MLNIFELLGGRKIFLGLLITAIGVLVDMTVGLSANLLSLLCFVSTSFFLANSAITVATVLKPTAKPEAAPVEIPKYDEELAQLKSQNAEVLKGVSTAQAALQFILSKIPN